MTKVVTVVKTKKMLHSSKKKGELMENDQDAMEVQPLFILLTVLITVMQTVLTFICVCVCVCVVFIRGRGRGPADGPHRLSDQTEESSGACGSSEDRI